MDTSSLVIGFAAGGAVLWLLARASALRLRAEAERDGATLRERAASLEAQANALREVDAKRQDGHRKF